MRKTWIEKFCSFLLFAAILAVGLFVYDDYGVCMDDPIERQSAIISYREATRVLLHRNVFEHYVPETDFGTVTDISGYRDKYYGVAMQLPLIFAEDMVRHVTGNDMGNREIYLMRHLYTFFLYYLALVSFYFLLKRMFGSRWLAIAGVLMVFLFPRYFAQSFYNIKDMVFASLTMIALFCAERVFATDRKPLWCALLAVSGALLVSSRIVGALTIVLVLLTMLLQDVLDARRAKGEGLARPKRSLWKRLLPYLLICCAYPVWILLTPAAWRDPIGFSLGYITRFSNYTAWSGSVIFGGEVLEVSGSAPPPRQFLLTWILLTVPIINQLLCLLGIGAWGVSVFRCKRGSAAGKTKNVMLLLMLLMLAGTLGYQFAAQPIVYNDWRHAFFLYPMMVTFAVYALCWIWRQARAHNRLWLGVGVSGILACSFVFNAYRIIKNHPYEYALCNVAGREYALDYERDYWDMSFYDMAEWLLKNRDGDINCLCGSLSARWLFMLSEGVGRFHQTTPEEADYIISVINAPGGNDFPVEGFAEIHAVWVDKAKIAAVYERIAP